MLFVGQERPVLRRPAPTSSSPARAQTTVYHRCSSDRNSSDTFNEPKSYELHVYISSEQITLLDTNTDD